MSVNYTQKPNGTMVFKDVPAHDQVFILGGGYASESVLKITVDPVSGVTRWASVENDTGVDFIITDAYADIVESVVSGSVTVDVGTTVSADGTSDNLLDGFDLAGSAKPYSNSNAAGTNGTTFFKWANGEYINVEASVSGAGITEGTTTVFIKLIGE